MGEIVGRVAWATDRTCVPLPQVTLDEFINGILRCKGNARAIDQLAMHSDLRQVTKKLL